MPGAFRQFRGKTRQGSVEAFVEAEGAQAENRCTKEEEGDDLGPQVLYADPFEEEAAHDLHEVTQRIQVSQVLHGEGHVADGKGKAAEQQRRHEEEKR